MMKYRLFLFFALSWLTVAGTQAQPQPSLAGHPRNPELRSTDPAFFKTAEALRIGDQVLLYQRTTGGWPKNIDMARPLSDDERAAIAAEKNRRNDSTTDNGATTLQMVYLARLYQATHETRFRDGFRRAVEYLLSGQYDNGGWPQFWPATNGTSRSTTTRW